MKNLALTLIALTSLGLFAQEEKKNDTTRFKFGSTEFIIINDDTTMVSKDQNGEDEDHKNFGMKHDKDDLTYWGGFDVGVNLMMNESFQNAFDSPHLDMDPAQSFSFSFNFAETRIRIIKDYFGLVTGLGFTHSRFGLNDNMMRLGADSDSTWGYKDSTLTNGFNKNQLRVNYFNIPLLFQVNTSKDPDKNFHFAFGAIGGVRIGSNMKYKYDVLGGQRKDKEKGKFNLNPFHVTGTFRMGYKDFGLFANYNLMGLFEPGKSEKAYPLTVGASLHF